MQNKKSKNRSNNGKRCILEEEKEIDCEEIGRSHLMTFSVFVFEIIFGQRGMAWAG